MTTITTLREHIHDYARVQLERNPCAVANMHVQPCTLRYARAQYALRGPPTKA